MPKKKIEINRAPVLTLWAAVVAERLGYNQKEALTLGKGVAGLNAQSKGRRLGIFEETKDGSKETETEEKRSAKLQLVMIMGRGVPAVTTAQGLRAAPAGKPIDPESVRSYLEKKFGDQLDEVRTAMVMLAKAYTPAQLDTKAFSLYEKFRPDIPEGKQGWGVKGELDPDYIRSLAK